MKWRLLIPVSVIVVCFWFVHRMAADDTFLSNPPRLTAEILPKIGTTNAGSVITLPDTSPCNILLLRTYMSTDFIPGYIGGPEPKIDIDYNGISHVEPVPAIAITYPPREIQITNYVLGVRQGTNEIEILTVKDMKDFKEMK